MVEEHQAYVAAGCGCHLPHVLVCGDGVWTAGLGEVCGPQCVMGTPLLKRGLLLCFLNVDAQMLRLFDRDRDLT